jgi:hypothetical protein
MQNYHDDTVSVRGTDASRPAPLPDMHWTEDELAELGIYRNLAAYR